METKLETLLRLRESMVSQEAKQNIDRLVNTILGIQENSDNQLPAKKRKTTPQDTNSNEFVADTDECEIVRSTKKRKTQKPASPRVGEIIAVRGNDDKVWYYEMQVDTVHGRLIVEDEEDGHYYLSETLDQIDWDTILDRNVKVSAKIAKLHSIPYVRVDIHPALLSEHLETLRLSIEDSPDGISSLNRVDVY